MAPSSGPPILDRRSKFYDPPAMHTPLDSHSFPLNPHGLYGVPSRSGSRSPNVDNYPTSSNLNASRYDSPFGSSPTPAPRLDDDWQNPRNVHSGMRIHPRFFPADLATTAKPNSSRYLSTATSQQLLQSENGAYIHLLRENAKLGDTNVELKGEVAGLKYSILLLTKRSTSNTSALPISFLSDVQPYANLSPAAQRTSSLKHLYSSGATSDVLSDAIIAACAQDSGHPSLQDLCWYPRDWDNPRKKKVGKSDIDILAANPSATPNDNKKKGHTRRSKDVNVQMTFLVGLDGVVAGGSEIGDLTRQAYNIWESWISSGEAPMSWGVSPVNLRDEYYSQMRSHNRKLGLCAHNWKADEIGKIAYHSWLSGKDPSRKSLIIDARRRLGLYIKEEPAAPAGPQISAESVNELEYAEPQPAPVLSNKRTAPDDAPNPVPKRQKTVTVAAEESHLRQGEVSAGVHVDDDEAPGIHLLAAVSSTQPPQPRPLLDTLCEEEVAVPPDEPPVEAEAPQHPGPPRVDPFAMIRPPASIATAKAVTTPSNVANNKPGKSLVGALALSPSPIQVVGTKAKKGRSWNPGDKNHNAFTICGRDWKTSHKKASRSEFETYWNALTKAQKQPWYDQEQLAIEAISSGSNPSSGVSG